MCVYRRPNTLCAFVPAGAQTDVSHSVIYTKVWFKQLKSWRSPVNYSDEKTMGVTAAFEKYHMRLLVMIACGAF